MPSFYVAPSTLGSGNFSTSMTALSGGGLLTLQTVLSVLGFNDSSAAMRQASHTQREQTESLIAALQAYAERPDEVELAKPLLPLLHEAIEQSQTEYQHIRKLQTQYKQQAAQASTLSATTTSYWQWGRDLVVGTLQSWLGTTAQDQTDYYAEIAEKRQAQVAALQQLLTELQEQIAADQQETEHTEETQVLHASQRHLLQTSTLVTVANPIPDQVIEATVEYSYDLSNVFSGDYTQIGVRQSNGSYLPDWLNFEPKYLGGYDTPGIAYNSVQVVGALAYVADAYSGLQILNVSNPANVTRLGGYDTPGYAYDVQVVGALAYVADGVSGLQILNVSNPANVTRLGGYDTPGRAYQVQVMGTVAYVADYSSDLQILGVSNPANVTRLGGYDTPGAAWSVQVIGTVAYVVDDSSGLQILNVSNPANITRLGGYDTPGSAYGVQVIGTLAYVADGYYGGLQILNVSNPANVTHLGGYDTPGDAQDVQLVGTVAYVVDGYYGGLQILDVSNPANIVRLGSYDTPGNAQNIQVIDMLAYVADWASGLQILDLRQGRLVGTATATRVGEKYALAVSAWLSGQYQVSDIFELIVARLPRRVDTSLITQSVFPGHPLILSWDSDILFTDVTGEVLHLSAVLINLTTAVRPMTNLQLRPTFVGGYDTPGAAYGVQVVGALAYVADNSFGLQILNVSNPAHITRLSGYDTPGDAYSVQVVGAIAYVTESTFGLQILNVSNPTNVTPLGSYNTPNNANGVQVIGMLAYVVDGGSGLQILNVSNPAQLTRLGGYDTPQFAGDVQVVGTVAYVADRASGLQILNVSNPANVMRLGSYYVPGEAWEVQVIGTVAYVTSYYSSGLQILNVSNPMNVTHLGSYDTSGNSNGVQVVGTVAYVADGASGLQILDVANPTSITRLGGYDTPVGAIDIQVIGPVAYVADAGSGIQILDLTTWEFTVNPTAAEVGNYQVTLTATNTLGGSASDSFLLRVEGPPQWKQNIPQQYAKVHQAFDYFIPQGLIFDPNLDPLSFSATLTNQQPLPDWLRFNGVSASFAGTPDTSDVGLFQISLSATDQITAPSVTTFSLYVDHAPELNQPPSQVVVDVNVPFQFALPKETFIDRDQDVLIYDARSRSGAALPPFLSFNRSTAIFSGSANTSQTGGYFLTVTADDPYDGQAAASLPLLVEYFPRAQISIPAQLAGVDQPFHLAISTNSFFDEDDLNLNYFARQSDGADLPGWLGFNRGTLEFSGLPRSFDVGSRSLRIVVQDSVGGQGIIDFNLTVTHFPVLAHPLPPLVFAVGSPVNWTLPADTFADLDAEPLNYTLTPASGSVWPSGLVFDPIRQRLSGLTNASARIEYPLRLQAQDPWGASASQNLTLTFENPPRVSSPVTQLAVGVNQAFTWNAPVDLFVDDDNDPLAVTVTQTNGQALPTWLHFYGPTVTLSGIPSLSDLGSVTLRFTATDPFGAAASMDMGLGVTYLPHAVAGIPTPPVLRADKSFNMTLDPALFEDADDPQLNYQLRSSQGGVPRWLRFSTAGNLTLFGIPSSADVGVTPLQLVAIDAQGGEAAIDFELSVEPNYPPSVMQPVSNPVAEVLELFRFFVPAETFSDRNGDPLSYRASRGDGGRLPDWLHFDPDQRLFSGTPRRGDTGVITDAVVDVAVTAADDQYQTSAPFRITVTGNSNLEIFLKIGLPIITVLSLAFATYQKRALLFNRCNPKRYHQFQHDIKIGEPFEYPLETPKDQVAKVQVKLPQKPLGSIRFFNAVQSLVCPSGKTLTGRARLPDWMEYDTDRNVLRSKTVVPEVKQEYFVVQVKNHHDMTVERFRLPVARPQMIQHVAPENLDPPSGRSALEVEAPPSPSPEVLRL